MKEDVSKVRNMVISGSCLNFRLVQPFNFLQSNMIFGSLIKHLPVGLIANRNMTCLYCIANKER